MFGDIALAVLSVERTLQVGFICPFVVIDPTDLDTPIVVSQALCVTIFNLSLTQNTCLFTDGNNVLFVCLFVCFCFCVCGVSVCARV